MRKELLYVAAAMALVIALGAGTPNWKGVSVRTDLPGSTANVESITFAQTVTATRFVGNGGDLSGIRDTNWWAVIHMENTSSNWTDVTVKISTNGWISNEEVWGYQTTPVFMWWSGDSANNGTPAWETFSTNWQPLLVFMMNNGNNPAHERVRFGIRDTTKSIHTFFGRGNAWDYWSGPNSWTLYIRDTGAWFHPTNRLDAVYLLQNNTANEKHAYGWMGSPGGWGGDKWRHAEIQWVNYDPRPAKFITVFDGAPDWSNAFIRVQHQQP